jgi:MFS transporter, FSR family, fosmidomycin resistance protein
VALLSVSHVVTDLYQGAVPAIIPFLAAAHGYSYLAISGITLAATAISSVAQPVFGVLADRHRMRWIVGAGILLAGAGVAVSGSLSSYPLLWAVIALSGIGVAAFHPEATRLVRRAAGSSAQGMSWFAVGGNIGFALAPLTITPVLLVTGLTGTLWLIVPAVLVVAILHALLPRLLRVDEPPRAARHARGRDDVRMFLWLTLVVIARSITFIGMGSFLALYVIRTYGVSEGVGAAAYTVLTGVGVLATITGGWLADRIGRVSAIRCGYLVAVPGTIGLLLAPNVVLAFAAVVMIGAGLYLPFSVHTTLGQEYLPNRIGTASGVTLGLAVSAGGIASPALGALADADGLGATLSVLCAMPVLALLATTRLAETRPRVTSRVEP